MTGIRKESMVTMASHFSNYQKREFEASLIDTRNIKEITNLNISAFNKDK